MQIGYLAAQGCTEANEGFPANPTHLPKEAGINLYFCFHTYHSVLVSIRKLRFLFVGSHSPRYE